MYFLEESEVRLLKEPTFGQVPDEAIITNLYMMILSSSPASSKVYFSVSYNNKVASEDVCIQNVLEIHNKQNSMYLRIFKTTSFHSLLPMQKKTQKTKQYS